MCKKELELELIYLKKLGQFVAFEIISSFVWLHINTGEDLKMYMEKL
jgi:hypothetical protein